MSMDIKAEPGEALHNAITRVIAITNARNNEVFLVFNELSIRVYPGSHEYDIGDKYNLMHSIRRIKVGYQS